MADTVKVPLLGVHKKGTVIGVTIGGAAVSGYMIWRYQKKKNAEQAAAATSAAQTSSAYGYGAYGYGQGQGQYPTGYYGYGEPGGGGFWPGGGSQNPPPPTPTPTITTNAEWAQAAIKDLRGEGFQARSVAEALGGYELGREVTPAQRTIIQAAIGVEGEPPVAGPNDYPPKIRVGDGGQQGQGQTVAVPAVEGKLYPAAASIVKARGLKPVRSGQIMGAITHSNPPAGTKVSLGSIVELSSFRQGFRKG